MSCFGLAANGIGGGYMLTGGVGGGGFAMEEMTPSRLLIAFLDFYVH